MRIWIGQLTIAVDSLLTFSNFVNVKFSYQWGKSDLFVFGGCLVGEGF